MTSVEAYLLAQQLLLEGFDVKGEGAGAEVEGHRAEGVEPDDREQALLQGDSMEGHAQALPVLGEKDLAARRGQEPRQPRRLERRIARGVQRPPLGGGEVDDAAAHHVAIT
jgi:hypothetical protein